MVCPLYKRLTGRLGSTRLECLSSDLSLMTVWPERAGTSLRPGGTGTLTHRILKTSENGLGIHTYFVIILFSICVPHSQLSPAQKLEFLATLISGDPLPVVTVERMLSLYRLDETTNVELLYRWIQLGLKARWEPSVAAALDLVSKVGRMKFLRPIYRDLYQWTEVRDRAVDTFRQNKEKMMAVAVRGVMKDLHLQEEELI